MATLSIPFTFSPGAKIKSSEHNANFGAVATWANGNIDQENFDTLTGEVTWSVSAAEKAIDVSSSSSSPAIHVTSSGTGVPLQLDSTTRGALLPRMTTTQRNAIASPAEGETIFNTTDDEPQFYNGTYWTNRKRNKVVSSSCGIFSLGASEGYTGITNFNLNITTKGGPVALYFVGDGINANGQSEVYGGGNGLFRTLRDSSDALNVVTLRGTTYQSAPGTLNFIDYAVEGTPGTYNYAVQAGTGGGSSLSFIDCILVLVEL